jgi:hypothetical protein
MRQLAWIVLTAVTLAGCAHEPIHPPASERSAPGQVSYSLFSDGAVSLAVVGYDRIERRAVNQTSYPALRVLMTLTNRGTQPWTVHPAEQIAFIERYGRTLPAATSDRPLLVGPGETRTLELFYPVPSAAFAQLPPQRISLQWRVRLPGGIVGDRARLDHQLASIAPPRA